VNPLDTLRAMILAARADGDADLAEWLASCADDPEALARVTGTDRTESDGDDGTGAGRWLIEHGFTGTITDAAGRKQQYADGKHVTGQHADPAPGASAHTSHEQDTAAASAQHDAAPAAEKGRFAKAREAIAAKLQKTAGGRAVLAMGKGGAWLFHKIERPLLYALHKTNEVAVAAAKERGFSDEATAKLKRVLMTADFLGGYATGAAALVVAGPIAGKIAAVMPSASVAYLAYSTARNPLATWKAAKKVVAETFSRTGATAHESEQDEARITPELAGMIADRIDRSDVDSEWWVACYHAALAHTLGDAQKAVELADAAVEAMPNEPAE
jgi:hypothetical protein